MSSRNPLRSWRQVEIAANEIAQNLETMARMQRLGNLEVTFTMLLAVAEAARDVETGARLMAEAYEKN